MTPDELCESGYCTHDTFEGVLVSDLLGGPGPYPDTLSLIKGVPSNMTEWTERIRDANQDHMDRHTPTS